MKVTMFHSVQFGRNTKPVHSTQDAAKVKPADLLTAIDRDFEHGQHNVGLGSDKFTWQHAPGSPDDKRLQLELRHGDWEGPMLGMLEELEELTARLGLKANHHVQFSPLQTPGLERKEHLLLQVSDERLYKQLLVALQKMGAVRINQDRRGAENHLEYAGIPILLFEDGLEETQLPKDILKIKNAQESLGRRSPVQQAANDLLSGLVGQGWKDVQVHPLELGPFQQLGVTYPVAGPKTRDPEQEQELRVAIVRMPEGQMVEGKLMFGSAAQPYPVSLAPYERRQVSGATNTNQFQTLKGWWHGLVQFLKNLSNPKSHRKLQTEF